MSRYSKRRLSKRTKRHTRKASRKSRRSRKPVITQNFTQAYVITQKSKEEAPDAEVQEEAPDVEVQEEVQT